MGRGGTRLSRKPASKFAIAKKLFALAQEAQLHGLPAEELLSDEIKRQERGLRGVEATAANAGIRGAKAAAAH